jgi:hypothetical protein
MAFIPHPAPVKCGFGTTGQTRSALDCLGAQSKARPADEAARLRRLLEDHG